jgi:Mrp family chromosome partitioning ATPase
LDTAELISTIQAKRPDVILIKEILPGVTGSSVAANLAAFTTASGIAVILYDTSNLHPATTKFPNVARFLVTDTPAELLKAVAAILS